MEFGIAIVPVEGLWKTVGMPGFISRDLTTIRIDRTVFEKDAQIGRYRATIAHEIAHVLLHADFYAQFSYTNEAGWMSVVQSIPTKDFKYLEWQADSLAGLICVPRKQLKREVQTAYQRATQASKTASNDMLTEYISQYLTDSFEVTPYLIRERIKADGLLPPPPEALPEP